MRLIDYFDRLYIIHLPERKDRYRALKAELTGLGIDISSEKVRIPDAPRPAEANGFTSRGVYGNFLSHLSILQEALRDGLTQVWVLEDDAIFRHLLRKEAEQDRLIQQLEAEQWELWYPGHSLTTELAGYPKGLVNFSGPFIWAHCYCVHQRVLGKLVTYMEETLVNLPGDPRGGRVYIDGAFTLFRQFHPQVKCLVSNPLLSAQKGSPSGLGGRKWYDDFALTQPLATIARSVRDEAWRYGT